MINRVKQRVDGALISGPERARSIYEREFTAMLAGEKTESCSSRMRVVA